jgi:hypothetical protein
VVYHFGGASLKFDHVGLKAMMGDGYMRIMSFLVLWITFAMSGVGFAQRLTVVKLKDVRSTLKAPDYTADERQLMADQALLFIENMFVHREVKIKDFGVSGDPVPRLKDVQRKAAAMDNQEFHETLQRIFLDLHDHHTNYNAPLPLGCSYVLAPLVLSDVLDSGKQKIVVSSISRLFKDISGEHTKAVLLDEVVAVNGTPIDDFMEKIKLESAGANPDAMTASALMDLTIRSLASQSVPKEDEITYTLKGANGEYKIRSDLHAIVNEPNCVKSTKAGDEGSRRPSGVSFTDMENPRTKVWRDLIMPKKNVLFSDDPLSEIANIMDLNTPAGKLTYVELFTFMPEESSVESLIHKFKDVLSARQESSVGLIIDVRGNGGGAIKLAEEMIQIFTHSQIEPMPVRLIPNQLNLDMFVKANGGVQNGWSQDVASAMSTGAKYTEPRTITTLKEANRFGQVWFKPVVVLTDANCYSACDLFAAGMQDSGAATIIGTHAATGAGGANVMTYDSFRSVFGGEISSNPFKALPGLQSMRVSWRQTLRTGKNAGKLIENTGIVPDILIRLTKADLGMGESRELMANVRKVVERLAPDFKGSSKLSSTARIKNSMPAQWKETVAGVDKVEVKYQGQIIETYDVDSAGADIDIDLSNIKGDWENKRFELIGTLSGDVKFRVVRELFWRGDDTKLTRSGLTETMTGENKIFRTFVTEGAEEDAWKKSNGVLRVGKGPKYRSEVVSEMFIPLDVSAVNGQVLLMVDFKLETEDSMDIFSIIARDTNTGKETYLYTLDGVMDLGGPVGIPIPNDGKNVEIVFEFESDQNWNMKGPEIRELSVKGRSQLLSGGGLLPGR